MYPFWGFHCIYRLWTWVRVHMHVCYYCLWTWVHMHVYVCYVYIHTHTKPFALQRTSAHGVRLSVTWHTPLWGRTGRFDRDHAEVASLKHRAWRPEHCMGLGKSQVSAMASSHNWGLNCCILPLKSGHLYFCFGTCSCYSDKESILEVRKPEWKETSQFCFTLFSR